MAQHRLRTSVVTALAIALLLGGGPVGTDVAHSDPSNPIMALLGSGPSQASAQPVLRSTIAFSSSRETAEDLSQMKIYLMNPDGTDLRSLTSSTDCRPTSPCGDAFAHLSPDGKRMVFVSNRDRAAGEPLNTSDLFLMNPDGHAQRKVTRGSNGTWSPSGKYISFHASASGTGLPINGDPGAATTDSDIFVVNVGDCLDSVDDCQVAGLTKNITNNADFIDDNPYWSPDGKMIVFTRDPVDDNSTGNNHPLTEIYVMRVNPDGTPVQDSMDNPQRLTTNTEEERAPVWSPNGERILFMCRRGGIDFELCTMKADGTDSQQLTYNDRGDLLGMGPWSPDGNKIVSTGCWGRGWEMSSF